MRLHEATLRPMKRKTFRYGARPPKKAALKEAAAVEEEPPVLVNVRAAKDQLSALLEQAARGQEIVITSDGEPKAKLVPFRATRKPFRVDWGLLRSMKSASGGPWAEDIVREDRDGRP